MVLDVINNLLVADSIKVFAGDTKEGKVSPIVYRTHPLEELEYHPDTNECDKSKTHREYEFLGNFLRPRGFILAPP